MNGTKKYVVQQYLHKYGKLTNDRASLPMLPAVQKLLGEQTVLLGFTAILLRGIPRVCAAIWATYNNTRNLWVRLEYSKCV
jgi:hypothetical protein